MNASAQVLQALDAAQDAFRQIPDTMGDRAEIARAALQQLAQAPWSMVARAEEAEMHGWLSQMREALQKIEQDPEGDDVTRLVEEGLWAANELERDLRQMVGALGRHIA
jgi:vacuolar-type H+-ATPase subunit E/Vma4